MILKRIKRIIELSKKDYDKVDEIFEKGIEQIPEEGDGKAVFLGEGSTEEYEDMLKEDKGIKGLFRVN